MQKTIPDNSNSSADYLSNDNKIDLGEMTINGLLHSRH
jgi:hypothetical protein